MEVEVTYLNVLSKHLCNWGKPQTL